MRYLLLSAFAAILAFFGYNRILPISHLNVFKTNQNTTQKITTEVITENDMATAAAASVSRSVIKKVFAVEQPEGVGVFVRRSIGTPPLRNLSPFLLLDHFDAHTPGTGFADHSHRGQATITYMLQGSSKHEDSEGHSGTIEAGGVQWMTAGRGVTHAEMPMHGPGIADPKGLQLWVDLPKQHKMTKPTYQELSKAGIPSAFPDGPDGHTEIRVISGKSYGVESPVKPLGGCWYFDIQLKKAGASVFQDIPAGWTAFLYLLSGKVKVGTSAEAYESYHTLVLSSKSGENGVALSAAEDNTRMILCAGEPLNQPVVQYGPFVMTTREEIMQTLQDYSLGTNGFEKAHVWKSKIAEKLRRSMGQD
ncbi:RmlC-like cupin [Calocera viscosa TUFC12733]|uniref:RmlC-like cupin n=1 Tax=Calocera viscosa (strain TUFC12733) TaxID=1330018 RepID=A0A167L028_CALVF|nr:RmlC-like cupin [Calocera viscosa TUFC12733]